MRIRPLSQPRGHDRALSAAARDQLAVPRVDGERGQRRRRAEPPCLAHEGKVQQRRRDRQPGGIRAEEGRFNGTRTGTILLHSIPCDQYACLRKRRSIMHSHSLFPIVRLDDFMHEELQLVLYNKGLFV